MGGCLRSKGHLEPAQSREILNSSFQSTNFWVQQLQAKPACRACRGCSGPNVYLLQGFITKTVKSEETQLFPAQKQIPISTLLCCKMASVYSGVSVLILKINPTQVNRMSRFT